MPLKEFTRKTKTYAKRFWHFLWNEDSVLSWIVNIVLAFLIIKFLLYPGIGLALGTDLPVVAVISESMDHQMTPKCIRADALGERCIEKAYEICGNTFVDKEHFNFNEYWDVCGAWYTNRSITEEEFKDYPLKNGFRKGDIIILRGTSFDDLKIGDVLVYQSKLAYPVIHRVVAKDDVIETKGDHNPSQIYDAKLNEKYITKDQMIGKAWIRIPYLGYIKIWFSELLQCVTFNGCFR